ncbi:hypothetical protein PN462_06590 [Spirulina sp. CS-785/01]|uniref:hypothetical protein n=1 Tax=Spirulina sp. CS-785/01 TaxID=3021716 RepID=UPI00232BB906|nr:hypothetical protein [Spirulina sp. CS-785/01]MDB9312762.1 hypothetical protein [Spirulina sp. CS-785/01]
MSSTVEQTPESDSFFNSKVVIYAGIAWGVLSLGFFLLSVIAPATEDTFWYLIGTYVAEFVPFMAAVVLCYRNWRSPKIMSGRTVWLGIGLGILSYFIADLIFGFWEIYWGLDPEISPADFFYMAFYICLGWGMILAVVSKRLNLEIWQWVTLSIIAVAGTTLAIWIALAEPAESVVLPTEGGQEAREQITETTAQTEPLQGESTSAPAVQPPESDSESEITAPQWVLALQDYLLQFSTPVNFFYIICDVALLIIAVTLLLAFWGGTFSLSWRMIAAAALAKYLADMWFKYAATLPNYESGGFLEVFFVFSGILFAIGAALEYDISSRPRRSRRRRSQRNSEVTT